MMQEEQNNDTIQYFEFTDELPCASTLFIADEQYQNAAAKFWPRLIDEIQLSNPKCTVAELSAMTASPLQHSVLFPELALEDDISRLWNVNMEDVMRESIAEIDILGPPADVTIRLLNKESLILERPMPPDCLDADTFQYFAAWLMEWGNIEHTKWNDETLSASIIGDDKDRDISYRMSFSITYAHISEGLHRRTVRLAIP